MGSVKAFLFGFTCALLFVGCAGAMFPYKYYALDADVYKGFLRGPAPKDDLDLEKECTPTASDKAPCIVMKSDAFIKAKLDYKDMQNRLKKCGG